jgi:carboxypeptidase C (cathepsin A)
MNNSIIHILSPHSFHWVRSKYGYQRLSEYQPAEMDSATHPAHQCLNVNTYLICYKYDAMQKETCFYTYIQTYKLRLLSRKCFQVSLSYLLKERAVKHGLNGHMSTGKIPPVPRIHTKN